MQQVVRERLCCRCANTMTTAATERDNFAARMFPSFGRPAARRIKKQNKSNSINFLIATGREGVAGQNERGNFQSYIESWDMHECWVRRRRRWPVAGPANDYLSTLFCWPIAQHFYIRRRRCCWLPFTPFTAAAAGAPGCPLRCCPEHWPIIQ